MNKETDYGELLDYFSRNRDYKRNPFSGDTFPLKPETRLINEETTDVA